MNKSSQSRFLARAARSPRRRCGTIGRTTGASASVWKQLLFVTLLTPALSVAEAADKSLIGFHQTALYCSGPGEWNAAASYAEYTHAKVSRGEIPWRCVEPNAPVNGVHSYNWSSIDGTINTLDVRGIKTVGMIMRPPSWANGSSDDNYLPWTGSESAWNAFVSKYATFAAAVAKRYKGKNVYYEIWNEPNERYFWHPAPETNRTLAIRRYGQPLPPPGTPSLHRIRPPKWRWEV